MIKRWNMAIERRHIVSIVMGLTGCRWRMTQQASRPTWCDVFWLCFLFGAGFYIWFWFYYWLLTENSMNLINEYAFEKLKSWVPLYFILFGLTCITLAYIIIMFILLLLLYFLGCQLYIHWAHRILLIIVLVLSVIVTIAMDVVWSAGWELMAISLMITAPFIHVAAVAVLTFASWFVVRFYMAVQLENRVALLAFRAAFLTFYIVGMLAFYLSPLSIRSPCIVENGELPPKPKILAHKGASAIAPENTLVAYEYAADFHVFAFESDVSVSFDGVPFILHDSSLRRTTNVDKLFPEMVDADACWFNMSQLQQLDAGSWYLEKDPYDHVSWLTNEERATFAQQKIPTLRSMLQLARSRNIVVLFDIKAIDSGLCEGHPYEFRYAQVIVDTIESEKFPNDTMWWLYYDIKNVTTSFRRVSSDDHLSVDELISDNATTVNFDFNAVAWSRNIMKYLRADIWVNIYVLDSSWFFSLCWCLGVQSVTTNKCHALSALTRPTWHLTPAEFAAMWLVIDCVSCLLVILIWIYPWKFRHYQIRGLNWLAWSPTAAAGPDGPIPYELATMAL